MRNCPVATWMAGTYDRPRHARAPRRTRPEASLRVGSLRAGVPALPRRRVGVPDRRRRPALRDGLPRGVPGGPLVAHDPPQARRVPPRVRRLRPREGLPVQRPRRLTWATLRRMSTTPESIALSKDLRKRGWTFVGPTTIYAFMQAVGIVNDHLDGCAFRARAERGRRAFVRPLTS